MSSLRSGFIVVVSISLLVIILVGCNGKGGVLNPEVPDVKGFILIKNGVPVAEVGDLGLVWGEVETAVEQGDIFKVEFLDENGDRIDLNSNNYSLSWETGSSDNIQIEKHDYLSKFEFHIHGIQEGQSSFEIHLLNENTKNEEYKSSSIPIKIKSQ